MDGYNTLGVPRERINGGRGVLKDLVPLCGPAWVLLSRARRPQCVCILCFIFLPFLFRLKRDSDQGLYHQLTSLCTIIIIKWADNQIRVLSLF
jgi:hypothetical protein